MSPEALTASWAHTMAQHIAQRLPEQVAHHAAPVASPTNVKVATSGGGGGAPGTPQKQELMAKLRRSVLDTVPSREFVAMREGEKLLGEFEGVTHRVVEWIRAPTVFRPPVGMAFRQLQFQRDAPNRHILMAFHPVGTKPSDPSAKERVPKDLTMRSQEFHMPVPNEGQWLLDLSDWFETQSIQAQFNHNDDRLFVWAMALVEVVPPETAEAKFLREEGHFVTDRVAIESVRRSFGRGASLRSGKPVHAADFESATRATAVAEAGAQGSKAVAPSQSNGNCGGSAAVSCREGVGGKGEGDGDDDDDDDDEVTEMLSQVPMRDPVSLGAIQVPVRGIRCDHLSVFDLRTHFQLFHSSPWNATCPICRRLLPAVDLRVDPFMLGVLRSIQAGDKTLSLESTCAKGRVVGTAASLPAEPRPRDVERINVFPDGHWEEFVEVHRNKRARSPSPEENGSPTESLQPAAKRQATGPPVPCGPPPSAVVDLIDMNSDDSCDGDPVPVNLFPPPGAGNGLH